MTAPRLVPILDLVIDLCRDELKPREALAMLRARGLNADITALTDGIFWQQRLTGLQDETIDPLTLCDGGRWGGSLDGCRTYWEEQAQECRDEALCVLAQRAEDLVSA